MYLLVDLVEGQLGIAITLTLLTHGFDGFARLGPLFHQGAIIEQHGFQLLLQPLLQSLVVSERWTDLLHQFIVQ